MQFDNTFDIQTEVDCFEIVSGQIWQNVKATSEKETKNRFFCQNWRVLTVRSPNMISNRHWPYFVSGDSEFKTKFMKWFL